MFALVGNVRDRSFWSAPVANENAGPMAAMQGAGTNSAGFPDELSEMPHRLRQGSIDKSRQLAASPVGAGVGSDGTSTTVPPVLSTCSVPRSASGSPLAG